VVVAVDGVPDNIPGELNRPSALGNYVMIKSPSGFGVVLAHLRQSSVAKRAGTPVQAGELLGQCGNSGNSTEPHLHMHVQSEISMQRSVALRMIFPSLIVDGVPKKDYTPKRGDILSNGPKEPNQPPTAGLRPSAAHP
jgi:murein DD-endopeptidase MepM/ murein hydrolase activator NlpD